MVVLGYVHFQFGCFCCRRAVCTGDMQAAFTSTQSSTSWQWRRHTSNSKAIIIRGTPAIQNTREPTTTHQVTNNAANHPSAVPDQRHRIRNLHPRPVILCNSLYRPIPPITHNKQSAIHRHRTRMYPLNPDRRSSHGHHLHSPPFPSPRRLTIT